MKKDINSSESQRSQAEVARQHLPETLRDMRLMDLDLDMDESRMDRIKHVLDQMPDSLVVDIYERSKLGAGKDSVSVAKFVSTHGISKAEAALLETLIDGGTVNIHSEEKRISVNTTRTHMRRLLEKTGARNQMDLIRKFYNPTH